MTGGDFHCHTTLTDGADAPEAMVRAAITMGLPVLGFSEHAAVPFEPTAGLSREGAAAYRRTVACLKERYAGQITLLCGIEMDPESAEDPADYDYVIGSVHFLTVKGETYAVDSSPEETRRCITEGFGGDGAAYAECYYEKVAALPQRVEANILAHFDLLLKFCRTGAAPDCTAPRYRAAALAAVEAAAGRCAVEINTGAMSRGWRRSPYPQTFLLRRLQELGGGVVLASDAHKSDALTHAFAAAKARAMACGFTTAGFTDRAGRFFRQF